MKFSIQVMLIYPFQRRLIPEAAPIFSIFAPFFRQWNSISRMSHIPLTIPILMLGGQRDEVVPSSHMRSLWSAANPVQQTNELPRNGKFVELPEGGHSKSDNMYLIHGALVVDAMS